MDRRGLKSDSNREAWITRWQVALALAALVASALWVTNMVLRDPDVPFLTRADDPPWITSYRPPNSDGIAVDQTAPPSYTFVRRFEIQAVPARAELRFRAVGDAELRLNERSLWRSPPGESWKREVRVEAAEALVPGRNELRVRVANPRGPALLQLRLVAVGAIEEDGEPTGTLVETDARWTARGPEGRVETMRADDTRPHPQSFGVPATGTVLWDRAPPLLLLFALGAGAQLLLSRRNGRLARAPEIVLALATAFWIAVYAFSSSRLPVLMGFDIVGHLAYVQFLLQHHAVPLATDGWSMYHPPLGHAVVAGLAALFDLAPNDPASRWVYRLPTFLAGLANVWAAAFAARRLFPEQPLRASLAIAFAALLPMNLYMSAYVSNEPMHSALVSTALCLACGLLVRPGNPPARLAALAATLGLAILTKFTALVAVPLVAGFQAAKARLVDDRPLPTALGVGGAVAAGAALVGGWVYLRNWRLLGHPVVGNWNLPGNRVWWEQPGFHTLDYYTSFGQSLQYPYFAGYASFWDGVYSTFWGDGLVSGMVRLATRHDAWSWDFMTATYWLAFPATVLLAVGLARTARAALRPGNTGRRLALSLLIAFLYASGFALFAITFRLPYYAQAKAFYVLSAIVPLSVSAAYGLAWPLERLPERAWPLRTLYAGWLGTLAGSIALAFLG